MTSMLSDTFCKKMKAAADAFVARERAWLPHDRRGRWVVLEPGLGQRVKESSRAVRQLLDRTTPRRARRFSSLSQARAFARAIDGTVHRWRRTPPNGGRWGRQSPWQRALETLPVGPLDMGWLAGAISAETIAP